MITCIFLVIKLGLIIFLSRLSIEKEFSENPLIKNLGITIHGSVHEAKQRDIAEKKVGIIMTEFVWFWCHL